ncbi:acyl-CoA thioester hydrolase/BAAT C-terminal domain-containing protein [Leekyejoonella antrihumi]|uniref:acyl-CoA thioester hydrolase/BAAT C-terminal domain-containing protein n=1 Tax=Leekyejoonella antrihumi TaxID=1660198 RepID=UPI001FE75CD5|nr:acyl-CoA thioester hydrolase/BAAT C-terminal domain-containing protein [Leekyejoonella antrihumi]
MNGVIAGVPSSVVNLSFPPSGASAWTWHGKPLAHASSGEWGDPDPPTAQSAVIPVEKIHGPLLLVCGKMDAVWPSCAYTTAIQARQQAHHFRYPVTALKLPNAGHYAGSMEAYYSATASFYSNAAGGTLTGNKQGEVKAHDALLKFLQAQR